MTNNIFRNNFKKVFSVGLTAILIVSGFFVFSGTALAADFGITSPGSTSYPTSTVGMTSQRRQQK